MTSGIKSQFTDDHFYTTSYDEMQNVLKYAKFEGTAGYCMKEPGCGLIPLYRFFSPSRRGMFLKGKLALKIGFLKFIL